MVHQQRPRLRYEGGRICKATSELFERLLLLAVLGQGHECVKNKPALANTQPIGFAILQLTLRREGALIQQLLRTHSIPEIKSTALNQGRLSHDFSCMTVRRRGFSKNEILQPICLRRLEAHLSDAGSVFLALGFIQRGDEGGGVP